MPSARTGGRRGARLLDRVGLRQPATPTAAPEEPPQGQGLSWAEPAGACPARSRVLVDRGCIGAEAAATASRGPHDRLRSCPGAAANVRMPGDIHAERLPDNRCLGDSRKRKENNRFPVRRPAAPTVAAAPPAKPEPSSAPRESADGAPEAATLHRLPGQPPARRTRGRGEGEGAVRPAAEEIAVAAAADVKSSRSPRDSERRRRAPWKKTSSSPRAT